jgi:lysophospholipase L1-like esterase
MLVISREKGREPRRSLGLLRFKFVQRVVLIYVATMLPLMAVDRVLRLMNVEIHVAPMVLKSRSNGVERYHDVLLKDPELLWKFEPGSRVFGRTINRFGFREREVTVQKEKGVRRVICLGDSVTAQGQPGYAQYLHELLTNAPPDGDKWEAFGMGVYGYSSQQGLRLFELVGAALQPDIVTVSFGRNDHNVAKEADRSRMAVRVSPFMAGLYRILERRHVGRLLLCAVERERMWIGKKNASLLRVSPEEYRENMNLFVEKIRAVGAIPILITAPRREIPQSYVKNGYARSTEEFQNQHDQYAEIARDVARKTGALLLDIQTIMAGKDCDSYFAKDAVHFDFYDSEGQLKCGQKEQPGLRRIAHELYGSISNLWTTSRLGRDAHAGQ